MDLSDIENIPEGANASEIAKYFYNWYADAKKESIDESLEKLNALAGAQWRAKEIQSKSLRTLLTRWLNDNYSSLLNYQEAVLGIAYCFGLDKEFFRGILDSYDGDSRQEFVEHLEKSTGDFIDPYWSIR